MNNQQFKVPILPNGNFNKEQKQDEFKQLIRLALD